MITFRRLLVSTPDLPPSVPRLARLEWERADGSYRRGTLRRPVHYAAVQITVAGRGALFRDGTMTQAIPRGRALVFVTGLHDVDYGSDPGSTDPYDFLYANLEGASAHAMIADLVDRHGHVLRIDPDHAGIAALAGLLPRSREQHRRIPAAANARLAFDLLAALIEANAPAGDGDDRLIDAAMTWLREHLDQSVSIAQVARRCGVSREHLTRVFMRRCGEAPATWLRRQRLRQAELLLRTGTMEVAAVAARCGFGSASHFAQVFRRATGVSPRRFRGG